MTRRRSRPYKSGRHDRNRDERVERDIIRAKPIDRQCERQRTRRRREDHHSHRDPTDGPLMFAAIVVHPDDHSRAAKDAAMQAKDRCVENCNQRKRHHQHNRTGRCQHQHRGRQQIPRLTSIGQPTSNQRNARCHDCLKRNQRQGLARRDSTTTKQRHCVKDQPGTHHAAGRWHRQQFPKCRIAKHIGNRPVVVFSIIIRFARFIGC